MTDALDIPAWMRVAERELAHGVHERGGAQNEPRILEYHASTTLRATTDEVAWCSSFVNWCLREAGIDGTRSAAARSWLTWGRALDVPRYGAIVVLAHGTNPAQGHVGFYVTDSRQHVTLLGGNQSNGVSIVAFPAARVLAYRWPSDVP